MRTKNLFYGSILILLPLFLLGFIRERATTKSGNCFSQIDTRSKLFTPAAGEPVPGAEILIEQEPSDLPVCMGKTNTKGDFRFKAKKAGIYNIKIFIPTDYIKEKSQVLEGKTDHLGTYHFKVSITSGKSAIVHNFNISAKEYLRNTKNRTLATGGPYSQSISNIEDNLIVVNVTLEKVGDYGINNEGIK